MAPIRPKKTAAELIEQKLALLDAAKTRPYKPRKDYLKAFDEGYEPPPTEVVREMIEEDGLSHSEFGSIVGVDARTVRRWTQVSDDPSSVKGIPYSAWRLFLILTGRVPAI